MDYRSTRSVTEFVLSVSNSVYSGSRLTLIGILHPMKSEIVTEPIRIDRIEMMIGRGKRDDGVDISIADSSVSRQHARIHRKLNRFYIEDLDSINGTFVDGVPVSTCLLQDGDVVQIGENQFYFERRYEPEGPTLQQVIEDVEKRETRLAAEAGQSSEEMTLQFWGTRGSLPTPGSQTRKYGGNTTCMEIVHGDTTLVIDAGSGLRELSKSWDDDFAGEPAETHLLFTHLHWDHIQGFPFWRTAYKKGKSIHVYSAARDTGSAEELLHGQMQGAYFPVPLTAMRADLTFHPTRDQFRIGPFEIEAFELPHPGGCLGYRITTAKSTLVIVTDSEFDQVAKNRDALQPLIKREYDEGLLDRLRGADLMVIDCQYTDEEYTTKRGWGHNSIATVADLGTQTLPKMLALTHHDPETTDEMVTARVKETADRMGRLGANGVLVFGAREQLSINVCPPLRPPKIRNS